MSTTKRAPLLSGPQPLAGLIDYQEGAIVSRTLIQQPAGTVTLFAFAEGEGLSEHTAPYDALFYVVEGEATVEVDGERYQVPAGHVILLPAHRPHAVEAPGAFKALLIMIRR